MPLLLVAAVGLPIWHVLSPKPWETNATSFRKSDSAYPAAQSSNSPISVYSQASYANPAVNGATARSTMPTRQPFSSGFDNANRQYSSLPSTTQPAPVGSNDMLANYSGQTLVFPGDSNGPDLTAPPMEFMPTLNFEEIFRFDVNQEWISQRWPRVSSIKGEDGLRGLRVALVTGTNVNDLFGSLTYFLDSRQEVQRITFVGHTGDTAKLIQMLRTKFDFRSENSRSAGLYVRGRKKALTGGLVLADPPVIRASNPMQRVALSLEINNPGGGFRLSPSFQSVVDKSWNN